MKNYYLVTCIVVSIHEYVGVIHNSNYAQDAGDGTLVTSLLLRRAGTDSFRKYVLVAENAIGKTIHDVDLLRGASNIRG